MAMFISCFTSPLNLSSSSITILHTAGLNPAVGPPALSGALQDTSFYIIIAAFKIDEVCCVSSMCYNAALCT